VADPGETSGAGPARVARTGIALVHQGEVVLPAAGSEAQAEQAAGDSRATVQYFFPVEVEVRAAPEGTPPQEIVDLTLNTLASGLAAS
jgi:hypothetical protein